MILNVFRPIIPKLVGALATAFLLAMAITWALFSYFAADESKDLMKRELDDVAGQIEEAVNARLIHAAMEARERLTEMSDHSVEALRGLADDLRVDEVCVADERGVFIASSSAEDIGHDCHNLNAQAAEFLCLLNDVDEYAQSLQPSAIVGEDRKYVGVWRPEGGFVQVGCREATVRRLAQSSLTGLTHFRHIDGAGSVVIAKDAGEVLSSALETRSEGSVLQMPGDDHHVLKRRIEGFPVYAFLQKSVGARRRNFMLAVSAALMIVVLAFAALFVGTVIARFVSAQIEKRLAGDLELAKSIQLSALPSVFPPYPEELRMDIFARMDTAREVGGDFYDFYHVGRDRFAVLIADVSGKGVPAALFMMRAKAILKSCMTSITSFEEAIAEANTRLAEANSANVFVTSWIGVIDFNAGRLEYVNCGHNPPCLRRANGFVECLSKVCGPALGVFDKVPYRKQEIALEPQDLLYLYTDGVTEAINREEEMFGLNRLTPIVAAGHTPEGLCDAVKKEVDAFAGEIEQFDDITQIAFRYRGAPEKRERTFKANAEALGDVTAFVEDALALTQCPDDTRARLLIAVDEITSNIVHHSKSEDMTVVLERAEMPPVVRLTFIDAGTKWNPLQHRDPDTSLGAEEREIGGLGLLMVKKLMDGVRYEWRDGHNVLSLRKNLPWNIQG